MVYVAGPYTHPDPVQNTHNTIRAGLVLRDAGYCPLIPHLSLLTHIVDPREPDYWYEWDLRLLDRCDVMVRLPGDSWGADREEEYANEIGVPVFHGTAEDFLAYNSSGEVT